MRDHIEPLSKFQSFRSVIAYHQAMRDADQRADEAVSVGDEPALDAAVEECCAMLDELLAALDHAADIGLLDELAGYLSATYGG